MKPQTRRTILTVAVALIIVIGAYTGISFWQSTVIIVDTAAPTINHKQTTHGYIAYTTTLTVTCVVTESDGMGKVEARLIDDAAVPPVHELQLTLKTHTGNEYVYQGTFTGFTPQKNVEYTIIYTAFDENGNSEAFATTITLVDLDGYVTLNGQKILPDDTIKLNTLNLDIKVYVTSTHSIVDSVYGTIYQVGSEGGTQTISFTYKTQYWQGNYTLPSDGTYVLEVIVKTKDGTLNRLASFMLALSGTQQNLMLLIVAFVLILALIVGYAKARKKTEK